LEQTENKQPVAVVPRISKLMALAIPFDQLLRSDKIEDANELAQQFHVTQPRISQILALNMLAPDIQEELLFLPRVAHGRPAIWERMLRPIAAMWIGGCSGRWGYNHYNRSNAASAARMD
jgi:hypothetical protein